MNMLLALAKHFIHSMLNDESFCWVNTIPAGSNVYRSVLFAEEYITPEESNFLTRY